MQKIKKLPEDLISKIAAGEVIERPAYALKELLENSVDAHASKIIVSLKNHGLSEIKVIDNGDGIEKEDLPLTIVPHSTSKITSLEDLSQIKSFGFRGEALSSIASISELEIKSKIANSRGYVISSNRTVAPTALDDGTQITIKHIFSKTPARKKFLSTAGTEYRHMLSQLYNIALRHPRIEFQLLNNEKHIHIFKPTDLQSRIKDVLGMDVERFLIPLSYKDGYTHITGFISHPQLAYKAKSKMFVFVNGRRVLNNSLTSAIIDSYKNLLMSHTYPLIVLSIEIAPDLIDVNVHPRKEIITFIDERDVIEKLKETIQESLESRNLTFANTIKQYPTGSPIVHKLREDVMATPEGKIGKVKHTADVIQLHNLFIVTETENGILLLDQHAVHEAILYYKYKQAYRDQKEKAISVKIPKPVMATLQPREISVFEEHKDDLVKLGFNIDLFGPETVKITAVPFVSTEIDPVKNMRETLDHIESNTNIDIDEHTNTMLAYLSCKSAIKSGEKLTKKQMKELISYLDKIDLGYTCPHGRPVKIELTKSYLENLFKR